jgi:hypothetical protein
MTILESGNTNSRKAIVDRHGRLFTNTVSSSEQYFASDFLGQAYQVDGTETPASGTVNVLHLENQHTNSKVFAVTYIRLQTVDMTVGAAADYWTLTTGEVWASGGDAVTPTNMNFGSGNTAVGNFYENGPTLSGTAVEFDRLYPVDNTQYAYNKEGSIVIPPGTALTVKFTSDETSGVLYARVSFLVVDSLQDLLNS